MESGKNFIIKEIPYKYPKNVLDSNKIKKIGYDPNLFTTSTLKRYFGYKFELITVKRNLVDLIFLEQKFPEMIEKRLGLKTKKPDMKKCKNFVDLIMPF